MKKILIVNSNYYKNISNNLVNNVKKKFNSTNYLLSKIDVPGVFEIPIAIRKNIKKFDAFIALGCVIKGQTPHFNLICTSTFNSISGLSINFNKPIGNGIITALNMSQAINRSINKIKKSPNKGSEAANAVISILENEPKKI
ncbi:6,7-dimethyl-8-ribityllumazine synthase [Pelagibacteraceae bacterium]|jgi:6,7-dimethyl-8-ribityllumazine synthase|nr:6,7-dimethyl-8-ribityllumazine synthase [Pelagibacteraceae bacterium]